MERGHHEKGQLQGQETFPPLSGKAVAILRREAHTPLHIQSVAEWVGMSPRRWRKIHYRSTYIPGAAFEWHFLE
jgi:hypothetical protein